MFRQLYTAKRPFRSERSKTDIGIERRKLTKKDNTFHAYFPSAKLKIEKKEKKEAILFLAIREYLEFVVIGEETWQV